MSVPAVNLNNQNNTDGSVIPLSPVPTNRLQALVGSYAVVILYYGVILVLVLYFLNHTAHLKY